MHLELGPLTIRTGKHRGETDDVAKANAKGGIVNQTMTDLINSPAASGGPYAGQSDRALGQRYDPGPLPDDKQPSVDANRSIITPGINQRWTPRTDYNQTAFDTLTAFAETCWPVRVCIETRKDQIESLDFDVKVRDGADDQADDGKLRELRQFFEKPDGVTPWSDWLRLALEEVLVKDALTLYRRPTRGKTGGLAASGFYGLEIIDGGTIKVLVDKNGKIPAPPAKAFRQIQYGAPMTGGDYTTDEIYYRPRTQRVRTPYGFSPVEWVLLTILTVINRQMFQLQYFDEGNVPAGLLEVAGATTPQQVRDAQKYWDEQLAGNFGSRQRIKVVGQGSKIQEFQKPDWSTQFEEFLVKVVGAAFAVPPSEIGFTNDVNRATGKQQENVVYRRGVKPMARYLKSIFDAVIANDLKCPWAEFAFSGGEPEDILNTAKADQMYVDMGVLSIDDVRQKKGQDPTGLGPFIQTSSGPVLVSTLVAQQAGDVPGGEPDDVVSLEDDGGEDVDDTQTGAVEAPLERKPTDGSSAASAKPKPAAAPATPGKKPATAPARVATNAPVAANAALSELKKWRSRAIKDVKKGAIRPFTVEHLPAGVSKALTARLAKASTVADVVAAFARPIVVKAERVSTAELRARRTASLEGQLAAYFRDMKSALLKHVGDHVK